MAACGEEMSKYNTLRDNNYTYPDWAPKIGLLITGSSVICIPAYAIYHLAFITSGTLSEVSSDGLMTVAAYDRLVPILF